MIKVDDGVVTAKAQVLALLGACCYSSVPAAAATESSSTADCVAVRPHTPSSTSCLLSVLPPSVLREFLHSWVLSTTRRVVLCVSATNKLYEEEDEDDDDGDGGAASSPGPLPRVMVVVAVGHTLGVTAGPAVAYPSPPLCSIFVLAFLNPEHPGKGWAVAGKSASLGLTDLGNGLLWDQWVGLGDMFEDNFGLAVSRRWVVCIRATAYSPMFQYSYAIKVWRVGESGCLEGGREPAAVLDLGDAAVLLPDSQPNSNLKEIKVKLAWTHCCSEGGCIEDGDELCIVADRNCKCCFNIVDIRKCLESQRITVIKRFCISRDPAWRDVESYRFFSTRDGGLSAAFLITKHPSSYWFSRESGALVQDVGSGKSIVLDTVSKILPLDDDHFAGRIEEDGAPPRTGVFRNCTNALVREWPENREGGVQNNWGNGFVFTTNNHNNKVSCFDALSGTHVVSFSVVGIDHPPFFYCLMAPPFSL